MMQTKHIYRRRFPESTKTSRTVLWETLCQSVFQRYVKKTDTVMDVGAGYCEFINAVNAKRKIAVDINPDVSEYADRSVRVYRMHIHGVPQALNGTVNIVFMSNFLEHLERKTDVLKVLVRARKLLASNGKLIILQPNIDLVKENYWDFFDHNIAFTTKNIREVLETTGFTIDTFVVRFLPYTTKESKLPIHPLLIRLYLALPEFLRPFAGQSLIIARGV